MLSPGVDPLKDVEALGTKLGFAVDNKNFHNVSLGQGQEIVAENALDLASKEGHWVVLQVWDNDRLLVCLMLWVTHNQYIDVLSLHFFPSLPLRIFTWLPNGSLSWRRS